MFFLMVSGGEPSYNKNMGVVHIVCSYKFSNNEFGEGEGPGRDTQ